MESTAALWAAPDQFQSLRLVESCELPHSPLHRGKAADVEHFQQGSIRLPAGDGPQELPAGMRPCRAVPVPGLLSRPRRTGRFRPARPGRWRPERSGITGSGKRAPGRAAEELAKTGILVAIEVLGASRPLDDSFVQQGDPRSDGSHAGHVMGNRHCR